jgi:hypothetical protein
MFAKVGPDDQARRSSGPPFGSATLPCGIIDRVNEIGTAPARGRTVLPHAEAERQLSEAVGRHVDLPERAVVSRGPNTCPACGSAKILWGHSPEQTRTPEECHPLIWNEIDVLADTFVCGL